ncbi:MAG: redox-regulated ATPase YchF [Candidatus Odinarchaeota archaeon]|nr:redox-regulated ATPase YchF [Candidatus Odinarchaeota archaeon]
MEAKEMLIGIVGKPSSGKTTFLNAACLTNYKTASYPFTTIEPQPGTSYVRVRCVCKEFNVQDNPRNSICINGTRFVQIKLLDVAGLVPDAWKGRGLGNKFLDDLRQADALIHIVDASGSLDADGKEVPPGTWDPIEDVKFLEREITMWMLNIVKRDWREITTRVKTERLNFAKLMEKRLSGLSINKFHILDAAAKANLNVNEVWAWDEEDLYKFVDNLRRLSKPMLIVANKIDKEIAQKNYEKMKTILKDYIIVPTSALSEYVLRTLNDKGVIRYIPGDNDFKILKKDAIDQKTLKTLELIKEKILNKYGSTGVQDSLDIAVFKLLKYIAVFPVEDANRLTDHEGNVLPDVFLVPEGTTARDLAYKIHTTLGDTFLYAIDVRTKSRLGEEYKLKHRDVIKIVATGGRK